MNSKEISHYIGKSALLRKAAYFFIKITTLREWYVRKALREVFSSLPPNFSFLDAGSGMGQHVIETAQRYPQAGIAGIEIDGEAVVDCNDFVKRSRIRNARFMAGDIADFSQDRAFDAILCCSVLEHIEEDVKVLAGFYRSLKIGGRLIVYVPTREQRVLASLERKIHSIVKRAKAPLPHNHVRYYRVDELVSKLQAAGFRIVSTKITYGPYGRLAYDIVTSVQYSPLFKWLFPLYLALVHPFVLLLMWADFKKTNKEGNGLMIVAQKAARVKQAGKYKPKINAAVVPPKGWYPLGTKVNHEYERAA